MTAVLLNCCQIFGGNYYEGETGKQLIESLFQSFYIYKVNKVFPSSLKQDAFSVMQVNGFPLKEKSDPSHTKTSKIIAKIIQQGRKRRILKTLTTVLSCRLQKKLLVCGASGPLLKKYCNLTPKQIKIIY